MPFVRVEQRNARLASGVRLDVVQGKDGPLTKGTAVAISNVRKGSGAEREEEVSVLDAFPSDPDEVVVAEEGARIRRTVKLAELRGMRLQRD